MKMKTMQQEQNRFARLFIKRLRRGGETRPIKYDRKAFALIIDDGNWLNLKNSFYYYNLSNGQERDNFLRAQVRSWFVAQKGIPECFDDCRHDILPKLESRTELEAEKLESQLSDHDEGRRYELIGTHLGLTLVYDSPDAFIGFDTARLTAWGHTFDEVMAVARQNLAAIGKPVFISPRRGLFLSRTADNYDATRLILVDLIRELSVMGAPIAMPVNRDTLIITGAEDEVGLAAMAKIAVSEGEKPYKIASLAFQLEGDTWVPWLPAPERPQYAAFKRLALEHLARAYTRQKSLLERECIKEAREFCFPASFNIGHCNESESCHSLTMLNRPVMPTSLPRTDLVFICREPGRNIDPKDACLVRWADAIAILGDTAQVIDIYPERYLIQEFPDENKWQQLKNVELREIV